MSRGFTTKELLMVFVVIGLLCAGAIPLYYMMRNSHRDTEFEKAVGLLQTSLAQWKESPENSGYQLMRLDSLPDNSLCKNCFSNIIPTGLTSDLWLKKSDSEYLFTAAKKRLLYDAQTGKLEVLSE